MMRRLLLLFMVSAAAVLSTGPAEGAKNPAKCALQGYEVVYASGRVRLLYRPRYTDYAVCDTTTGRASDLVGSSGEKGRKHQVHNHRASGTKNLYVDLASVASNGRWLILRTDLPSERPTVYSVAWNVATGTVRVIGTTSYRGLQIIRAYVLSDGTAVYSTLSADPGGGSSSIAFDTPGKAVAVLEEGGGVGSPTSGPDADSLAVVESKTGRAAYWKNGSEIRSATIPRAAG